MRRSIKFGALTAVLVLCTGCASTMQYRPLPDQGLRVEDPSKARIYVVRPTAFGGAIAMDVTDGDKRIGRTGPNGYLCWEREPGRMDVRSSAENTADLSLDTEKGMVYYIQQHVRFGFFMARTALSVLTEAEGGKKVAKCKAPQTK